MAEPSRRVLAAATGVAAAVAVAMAAALVWPDRSADVVDTDTGDVAARSAAAATSTPARPVAPAPTWPGAGAPAVDPR